MLGGGKMGRSGRNMQRISCNSSHAQNDLLQASASSSTGAFDAGDSSCRLFFLSWYPSHSTLRVESCGLK